LYRIIDLKNKSNNEVYVFAGQTKIKQMVTSEDLPIFD